MTTDNNDKPGSEIVLANSEEVARATKSPDELFGEYERADANWEAKKKEVEEAYANRSDAVKAIAAAVAPKKTIVRRGQTLTICVRGDSWYFRGPKNAVEFE